MSHSGLYYKKLDGCSSVVISRWIRGPQLTFCVMVQRAFLLLNVALASSPQQPGAKLAWRKENRWGCKLQLLAVRLDLVVFSGEHQNKALKMQDTQHPSKTPVRLVSGGVAHGQAVHARQAVQTNQRPLIRSLASCSSAVLAPKRHKRRAPSPISSDMTGDETKMRKG